MSAGEAPGLQSDTAYDWYHSDTLCPAETSGITETHGSLVKLTDKISDIAVTTGETRAEVRSLYQQSANIAAAPAPPPQPARAVKRKLPQEDNVGIFSR